MKKTTIVFGAVLILLGIAALIHPRVDMPAKRTEVQVLGQKLLVETRRVVTIPSILSGLLIVAGVGLIILGPRAATPRK
jgi:hypothetical protein